MKVLGVAPKFDAATEYSFRWYKGTVDKTKGKYVLKELLENEAVRTLLDQMVEEFKPDILLFYDHGDEDILVQQGGGSLVDKSNVGMVKNRVVYTMACLSAKGLGVEAWKMGCVYVGYTELFYFTAGDESLFSEAAGHGFTLHVNGESDWAKIRWEMIKKFDEMINKTSDPWSKMWLVHDRDCLAVYNGETPRSKCAFRKVALKLFGEKGWNLRKAIRGVFSTPNAL